MAIVGGDQPLDLPGGAEPDRMAAEGRGANPGASGAPGQVDARPGRLPASAGRPDHVQGLEARELMSHGPGACRPGLKHGRTRARACAGGPAPGGKGEQGERESRVPPARGP